MSTAGATPRRLWLAWRDPRVWRMGLMLGGANATYFGLNGFLSAWLTASDVPGLVRPALTALNLTQMPASLLMLALTGRLVRRRAAYGIAGAMMLAGVLGCVAMPGPAAVGWAGLAGFAAAVLLTLALALPSLLGTNADSPRLAAAMFTISYGLAVAAAVMAGQLWDESGAASLAFLPFALAGLVATLLGATLPLRPTRSSNRGDHARARRASSTATSGQLGPMGTCRGIRLALAALRYPDRHAGQWLCSIHRRWAHGVLLRAVQRFGAP